MGLKATSALILAQVVFHSSLEVTRAAEPLTFFTNVAERLLQSQLNMSVRRIPIAPSNEYSLEVHRLLQVAANLYDATHSDPFPSVFRPLIGTDPLNPGGLAITNYVCDAEEATLFAWLNANPYGIPLVIGAKKGIPNFNEFVFQTSALCARKLELRRPSTNSPPTETNQQFIVGISNLVAVEAWNSYTQSCCNGDVTIAVGVATTLTISNRNGLHYATNVPTGNTITITSNTWQAFGLELLSGGFLVPLYTNIVLLPNSAYRTDPPRFEVAAAGFEDGGGFPVPEWTISISNSLTYILFSNGRILDFALLRPLTNSIEFSSAIFGPAIADPLVIRRCWSTNRVNGSTDVQTPTEGVLEQLRISAGEEQISPSDWNGYHFGVTGDIGPEIDHFRSFLQLPQLRYTNIVNTNLIAQAPFSPARKIVHTVTWQANDPMVHHMVDHLKDSTNNAFIIFIKPIFPPSFVLLNLTNLNPRYRPWLGNPQRHPHPNDVDRRVKDPLALFSDTWAFPTNLFSEPGLIGRVHRGTPWQTIYLKSEIAEPNAWHLQWFDARSHPTSDWKTVSVLLPLLVTSDVRERFSINEPDAAAWRGVLHAVTVVSNLPITDPFTVMSTGAPEFDTHTMQSNSIQAEVIAEGILQVWAERQPPCFRRVSDVLATPELSVASPWLNTSSTEDLLFGLTDQAYEKIAEQLLPRLRSDPVMLVRRNPADTEITVEAYQGYIYRVEASVDLKSWRLVEEVFADTPTFVVTDETSASHTFYRAILGLPKSLAW